MQRQIKFKGWNKNTNKMLDLQALTSLVTEVEGLFLPRSEDIILLQSTGLLDKNGKEIYEGDVIERSGEVWMVKYSHNEFSLWRGNFQIGDNNDKSDPVTIYWNELEIIGNIYENPELI